MKKTNIVTFLFLMVLFISGCKKDKLPIQDGIYTGTFTVPIEMDPRPVRLQ